MPRRRRNQLRRRARMGLRRRGRRTAAPQLVSPDFVARAVTLIKRAEAGLDSRTPESKDSKTQALVETKEKAILEKFVPQGIKGWFGRGAKFETTLVLGYPLVVNTNAGKYLLMVNGATSVPWNYVASTAEFTALDAIFDEFFVRKVTIEYHPVNKYSSNSTASGSAAGSPGQLNTLQVSRVFLPHAGALYADSATIWQAMLVSPKSGLSNLAMDWRWTVTNEEKFTWDGPLGDMSTAGSTMSWCQTTLSSKYGGNYQFSTPDASGAAAGIGTLLEGGVFGHVTFFFDIAFRSRA